MAFGYRDPIPMSFFVAEPEAEGEPEGEPEPEAEEEAEGEPEAEEEPGPFE